MTREEVSVEYSGYTHHNHLKPTPQMEQSIESNTQANQGQHKMDNQFDSLSTITILHRHPMYDSLVLIKRYRACLKGYSLEFPTSEMNSAGSSDCKDKNCCKSKLVSMYLDGDDPIYQSNQDSRKQKDATAKNGLLSPEGEIVHVPLNGLLDRLNNYDRHGISIDSRVYAFAMGLKTAEKFLSTCSVRELQEEPPL